MQCKLLSLGFPERVLTPLTFTVWFYTWRFPDGSPTAWGRALFSLGLSSQRALGHLRPGGFLEDEGAGGQRLDSWGQVSAKSEEPRKKSRRLQTPHSCAPRVPPGAEGDLDCGWEGGTKKALGGGVRREAL